MILTVDIGNSRIKSASWLADKIVGRGVVGYVKDSAWQGFDEIFSSLGGSSQESPSRVLAVCVAGEEIASLLSDWVKQRWLMDVEYLQTEKQFENITNAYDDPAQHGVDRWAAVVAGHLNFPDSSVCVISAGTAITFDLINKGGQHLGGYILPSYATMHAALLADTANVSSEFNMQFHQHSIPNNTNDAVNQGLHKLIQAGIRELCQFAQDKLDQPMQIIITGGFAESILDYPDMPTMHYEPDLVMQGLYNIMKQRKR
jgi:type III pantothenate kinase